MGVRFLDDAASAAFERAIQAIEQASAVEVVVAVRRRSGDYRHANGAIALAFAFGALAITLFAETEFSVVAILAGPMLFAIGGFVLPELVPWWKGLLTSRASLRAHVQRAAKATFVERGVHNTTGRSGVLAYISLLEGDVALVPDSGLVLPAEVLARVEAAMADAIPKGGAAVAAALGELTPHCARALPHQDDDVNELPDVVHSDEKRRR